ncbi:hypothetical protein [Gracilibacillus sp. YIM 98692]|uniref:hypothetical protein n=1 Tax=Gracilibacillus sp. YIM 98692 TaxID=2663532 RepID=UPI0013CFE247|nr:hypothetical protein [Gracilibacillus sp. YIM 98692]
MNTTLAKFLGIGITALTIGLLLFGFGFGMAEKEAGEYEDDIDAVTNDLPASTTNTP